MHNWTVSNNLMSKSISVGDRAFQFTVTYKFTFEKNPKFLQHLAISIKDFLRCQAHHDCHTFGLFGMTYSPSQSAPTILKNQAPCFLKKAGWKKQGHSLFKKRRDQAASSLFELQWPWFFALCFFQKAGCPIFKNSGCRLTGRLCFRKIGGRAYFINLPPAFNH